MMKTAKIILCVFLVCLWASIVNASIVYEFSTSHSNAPGFGEFSSKFTLVSDGFITSNLDFTQLASASATFENYNASLKGVSFVPNYVNNGKEYDMVSLGINIYLPDTSEIASNLYYFYFAKGAFSKTGSYETVLYTQEPPDTLKVSAPTPLPPAFVMFAPGVASILFLGRRKRQS